MTNLSGNLICMIILESNKSVQENNYFSSKNIYAFKLNIKKKEKKKDHKLKQGNNFIRCSFIKIGKQMYLLQMYFHDTASFLLNFNYQ